MRYRETRRLSAESLRALCVQKDWYTRGDNEEYGHMLLDMAAHKDNLTTDDIIAIAEDIAAHSDLYEDEDVGSIAFEVARACTITFQPTGAAEPPNPVHLNGPWSNDACMGYAIMALRRAGMDKDALRKAVTAMWYCFDEDAIEDAAACYRDWQG